jgi:hypothetical protein
VIGLATLRNGGVVRTHNRWVLTGNWGRGIPCRETVKGLSPGVYRIYREAVTGLSPGFQPWVQFTVTVHPEGVSDFSSGRSKIGKR